MVRFDAEVSRTRRSVSDTLVLSQRHLRARTNALTIMKSAISAQTCQTSDLMKHVGKQLAEMSQAELRYGKALMKAWRIAAESLERTADLLVDGGLLLHYLRLVSTTPLNVTNAKEEVGSSVVD